MVDPKCFSPGPVTPAKSGLSLFVKVKGIGWRAYCPDGNPILGAYARARELYELAVNDPSCESAVLVETKTLAGFNRGDLNADA